MCEEAFTGGEGGCGVFARGEHVGEGPRVVLLVDGVGRGGRGCVDLHVHHGLVK